MGCFSQGRAPSAATAPWAAERGPSPALSRFQRHVYTYRILPDEEGLLSVQVGAPPALGGASELGVGGMRGPGCSSPSPVRWHRPVVCFLLELQDAGALQPLQLGAVKSCLGTAQSVPTLSLPATHPVTACPHGVCPHGVCPALALMFPQGFSWYPGLCSCLFCTLKRTSWVSTGRFPVC